MALQGIEVLLQEASERPEQCENLLQICWALSNSQRLHRVFLLVVTVKETGPILILTSNI